MLFNDFGYPEETTCYISDNVDISIASLAVW
jgi:hypothetical protein